MPPHPRILVVEHSRSLGELLGCALEQEGCTTLLAWSARQGFELAQRVRPEVIALDIGPDCPGGLDLIAALGLNPATRHIPIVALSARPRDLPSALGPQVARVFGEPFYPAEVVSAILQTAQQVRASMMVRPATPR